MSINRTSVSPGLVVGGCVRSSLRYPVVRRDGTDWCVRRAIRGPAGRPVAAVCGVTRASASQFVQSVLPSSPCTDVCAPPSRRYLAAFHRRPSFPTGPAVKTASPLRRSFVWRPRVMPSPCSRRFVVGLSLIAVVQVLLYRPAQCSSTLMKYLATEYNLSQVSGAPSTGFHVSCRIFMAYTCTR